MSATETIGGLTLSGALYFSECFLTGCRGPAMLIVYLNFSGSSILGFIKPITAGLTFTSIVFGFIWINRKNNKNICCDID